MAEENIEEKIIYHKERVVMNLVISAAAVAMGTYVASVAISHVDNGVFETVFDGVCSSMLYGASALFGYAAYAQRETSYRTLENLCEPEEADVEQEASK